MKGRKERRVWQRERKDMEGRRIMDKRKELGGRENVKGEQDMNERKEEQDK